jgi:hypothetical protein
MTSRPVVIDMNGALAQLEQQKAGQVLRTGSSIRLKTQRLEAATEQ